MAITSSLTILFEDPFWIGLYERTENCRYEVCKITFGPEPKNYEVYEFLRCNWHSLKFSPSVHVHKADQRHVNPKRLQRKISSQLQERNVSTKAQQALQLQHEQGKLQRKVKSREEKETKKERKYELRQEKRKAKHKGR